MKPAVSSPSEPKSNSDSKLKLGSDGKLKPLTDGKVKPGAYDKLKPGADGKLKAGGDGKPKPSAGGKVKPSADGNLPKKGDGKPKPGAGSKVKPSADNKPKPGDDSRPKPSADDKPKCSREGGPKPSDDKSDCGSDLKPSPKSGPRPRHESKVKSSVTLHGEKAAPVYGDKHDASSAVLIKVSASNGRNGRIQLRSLKKVTETPKPQVTAGQPETEPTTCTPSSKADAAGHKSTRRPAPPPPGGPRQPKTDTARNSCGLSGNGTAAKVHNNAAGASKTHDGTSKGSRESPRNITRAAEVSANGSTSSKDNVYNIGLPKNSSRQPRGNAGPNTVHSRSGTEHAKSGQHMNGDGAFNSKHNDNSAGVLYRAQEENVSIPSQTGVR